MKPLKGEKAPFISSASSACSRSESSQEGSAKASCFKTDARAASTNNSRSSPPWGRIISFIVSLLYKMEGEGRRRIPAERIIPFRTYCKIHDAFIVVARGHASHSHFIFHRSMVSCPPFWKSEDRT